METYYSHLIYTLQDYLKEMSKYYHQALDRKSLLTSVLIEVPKEWEQKDCGIVIKRDHIDKVCQNLRST